MLHALRPGTAGAPGAILRAMFAARKEVFVDLLKWTVPVIDGRYEVDQFDDEHAHYLVLTDPHGRHLGSTRLLSTTRPHILGTLYPQLCDDEPLRGGDIYEITRFCLDRRLSARERRTVRNTLVTAIAAHAIDHRIGGYTAIAELGWLRQILAFGWRCRPLGQPQPIDGKLLGALHIEIDGDTLALLARSGIRAEPGLMAEPMRAAA